MKTYHIFMVRHKLTSTILVISEFQINATCLRRPQIQFEIVLGNVAKPKYQLSSEEHFLFHDP